MNRLSPRLSLSANGFASLSPFAARRSLVLGVAFPRTTPAKVMLEIRAKYRKNQLPLLCCPRNRQPIHFFGPVIF